MGRLKNLSDQEYAQLVPEGLILLGYRGSIAHGMYVPNTDPNSIDDKDVMGVFIPPIDHYFGFNKKEHHEKQIKEWDAVSYELRKFVNLLANSNPNVLSLLWLTENNYIEVTDLGRKLIDNRELFVSKRIFHSFTGYALAQLKKMTSFTFNGYMGEKRKGLVEKYGYDCKNAAHLIRLLRMGIEFLNEGVLHVMREDAPQLLEIKTGKWTLEKVKEEADRLFARAESVYDQSSLPPAPDSGKVNELVVHLLEEHFGVPLQPYN